MCTHSLCVRISAAPLHVFVCLHPEMWPREPAEVRVCVLASVSMCVFSCACVRVCVPASTNSGAALSLRCLHRHSVTVRSPEETAEAAAVRRSQLPLVTLVSSNLEEINSEP